MNQTLHYAIGVLITEPSSVAAVVLCCNVNRPGERISPVAFGTLKKGHNGGVVL